MPAHTFCIHPYTLYGLREDRMRMAAEKCCFFHFPIEIFEVMCSAETEGEPNKFAFINLVIAKRVKAN